MDLEEAFYSTGHLLLDMRPQNVYFDPGEGKITVIDIGTMPTRGPAAQGRASMGDRPGDIHDFFAEMFKFYATPDSPPSDVRGYGEAAGMRSVPDFDQQLDMIIHSYLGVQDTEIKEVALDTLQKVRTRDYTSFEDFRRDFNHYLAVLDERNKKLPYLDDLVGVWGEAMQMMSADYWRKFLFDPDSDLVHYRIT
jgi:hypothetical protein